jgi:uncharacterized membrane protein YeaQ/YmgE (transglycosylase-associated protein family)
MKRESITLWDLIVLVIFGAIVGWIASILVGRSSKMGCGANVVIGILESIIGSFVVRFFFPFPRAPVVGRFNLYSIAVGVLGAVVLLVVTGWYKKPPRTTRGRRDWWSQRKPLAPPLLRDDANGSSCCTIPSPHVLAHRGAFSMPWPPPGLMSR